MINNETHSRLLDEREELNIRTSKLRQFILTPKFRELPREQRHLLELQADVMNQYESILLMRLEEMASE